MTFLRGALAVAVRIAVLVAFYLIYLLVLSRSESIDPLGAGLLFLLMVVVATFVWAWIDGYRHGLVAALVGWLIAAVGTSVVWSIIFVVTDGGRLGEELSAGVAFFVPLLFIPTGLGSVIGELMRRGRAANVAR